MSSNKHVIRTLALCASTAALSITSTFARAEAAEPTSDEEERSAVTVSVVHPLATNAGRPNVTTNTDLSILWGRVGTVEGAQIGGAFVSASRGIDGAQIGGVATIAVGPVRGAQLAGAANVAEGVAGAQLAPVNVAGPVDGVQLGVFNVGRKVRGLQVGLVNIAEDVDGGAIGLVSISRDSVHPLAWTSNLQYTNAGVKFTNKYVFTMVGVHYGTHEADFDHVGLTAAIGGHVPLPASFDLEIQGSLTQLATWTTRSKGSDNTWVAPQIVAGYSVATHFRVFAGGGVRLPVSVELGRDVSRPEALAGVQF